MSLMAGFDFVAEISNATLLKLVKGQLQIGGTPANPPFEATLPLSAGGVTGNAHLIVDDIQLDLNADDSLTLTFLFSDSSVVTDAPLALTIAPLDGSFTIRVAIAATSLGGSAQTLSIDLAAATIGIAFSTASQARITTALGGGPMSVTLFQNVATQGLGNFVHGLGRQTFPIAFNVVPGVDGSFQPLQLESLVVHCISSSDRNSQALGLLGTLLARNHSSGTPRQKNSTAITAGHDVAVSLSPGAFHSLAFCPSVAASLSASVSSLPASCGGAAGLETGGVTLTNISDTFANGHINVDGTADKSGFCYDAHAMFHAEITLFMSGTTLTPTLSTPDVSVDVDIPWYCYLAAGLILGPLGIVITGIVNAVADNAANGIAQSAVGGVLGNGLPGISTAGLTNATFDEVAVTTEGITMNGHVQVPLPAPSARRSLRLRGSVMTTRSTVLSSGVFHSSQCPEGDFPYTESANEQVGSYEVSATLLGEPYTLEWWISAPSSPQIRLTGNRGTAVIPTMDTQYALPLPAGSSVTQPVHVGYTISNRTIQLTNLPAEGNYSFRLHVRATDLAGVILETSEFVLFTGNTVAVGGGYINLVQQCIRQDLDLLRRERFFRDRELIPKWIPVNYPRPDELVALMRNLTLIDKPRAEEVLSKIRLAHGISIVRVLNSPEALQVGLKPDAVTRIKSREEFDKGASRK